MSHQLAAQLAGYGRGPDTMLMHVAPSEVAGLAALARAYGGDLTVNPKTGLPEAGFLSAILPMVAGAFLGPAGIGLFSSGLGAAAAVGGATALTSGSLSKGLMAGLGAYGGFGLGEGLMNAGAAAGAVGAGPGVAPIPPVAMGPDPLGNFAVDGVTYSAGSTIPQAAAPMAQATAPVAPATSPEFLTRLGVNTTTTMPNWARLGDGLGAVAKNPADFFTANNWQQAKNAGMALAPMFMSPQGGGAPEQPRGNIKRFTYSRNPQDPGPLEDSSERTWFNPQLTYQGSYPAPRMAAGGAVDAYSGGGMTGDSLAAFNYLMGRGPAPTARPPQTTPTGPAINIYRRPTTDAADASPAPVWMDYGGNGIGVGIGDSDGASSGGIGGGMSNGGEGGPDGVGGWARGGEVDTDSGGLGALHGRMLRGPGDGVSDDIPAVIDGDRPAALADGEFVIPARAVSEIGNGSSEAGARRLYAMLDRIQKRRSKSMGGNVAVDSGAWQELPA